MFYPYIWPYYGQDPVYFYRMWAAFMLGQIKSYPRAAANDPA